MAAVPGSTASFGIGRLSPAGTTNVFSPAVNRRSGSYQGAFLLLYVGG